MGEAQEKQDKLALVQDALEVKLKWLQADESEQAICQLAWSTGLVCLAVHHGSLCCICAAGRSISSFITACKPCKDRLSIVERLEKELEPLVNRADAAPALANSKIARRALMPQFEVKICKITANVLLASETGSVSNACEQRMHWKWKLRHTCCLNVLCAGLLTISRFEWQGSLWISNR